MSEPSESGQRFATKCCSTLIDPGDGKNVRCPNCGDWAEVVSTDKLVIAFRPPVKKEPSDEELIVLLPKAFESRHVENRVIDPCDNQICKSCLAYQLADRLAARNAELAELRENCVAFQLEALTSDNIIKQLKAERLKPIDEAIETCKAALAFNPGDDRSEWLDGAETMIHHLKEIRAKYQK